MRHVGLRPVDNETLCIVVTVKIGIRPRPIHTMANPVTAKVSVGL